MSIKKYRKFKDANINLRSKFDYQIGIKEKSQTNCSKCFLTNY